MSFEKQSKGSGVRRKARECALQMLFAADFLETDRDATVPFWSEFGFESLAEGSAKSISAVPETLDRLRTSATRLRPYLKKLDPYDRNSPFLTDHKELVFSLDRAEESFKTAMGVLVSGSSPDLSSLRQRLASARDQLGRLAATVSAATALKADEKREFAGIAADADKHFEILSSKSLIAVEKLAAESVMPRQFADRIVTGTLKNLAAIDKTIMSRAEHWRLERMAVVDRNILRLAVYEFLYEDTPGTVVINEALEIARTFSSYEATQFINGLLDAIRLDLEGKGDVKAEPTESALDSETKTASNP